MTHTTPKLAVLGAALALSIASCGSADEPSAADPTLMTAVDPTTTDLDQPVDGAAAATTELPSDTDTATSGTARTSATEPGAGTSTFQVDVWADNWMAVYVDGVLIGEDSVPITTERSFNTETFTFEATLPFTIAIEAKDFKETDSGLEYIGEQNQQMGDGGLIAQVTDLATGEVVAATDTGWSALVVHQAPLDTECEDDPDPDSTCEFLIVDIPTDWTSESFDDSGWADATEWSEATVSPKDGYSTVDWDASARLVWGADLEVDNTVLLRFTVG